MNSRDCVIWDIDAYRDKKRGLSRNHSVIQKVVKDQKMDDLLKTYIEKVDKDQMALREEMREREQRTEKRIDDSERRMEDKINKIEQMLTSQSEKFDELKEKISDKMDEDKKFHCANMIAIISAAVGTILTIVSLNHSVISTVTSILELAK